MSRDKDPECRGYLAAETENAILVSKNNPVTVGQETWWIPRSQIGYLRKTEIERGQTYVHTEIVFTIPEWLIEKKQCWELVP